MSNNIQKPMTEAEIALISANVRANFAIEGMELSEETISLGEKYLRGEISSDDVMKTLIDNYGEEQG